MQDRDRFPSTRADPTAGWLSVRADKAFGTGFATAREDTRGRGACLITHPATEWEDIGAGLAEPREGRGKRKDRRTRSR